MQHEPTSFVLENVFPMFWVTLFSALSFRVGFGQDIDVSFLPVHSLWTLRDWHYRTPFLPPTVRPSAIGVR